MFQKNAFFPVQRYYMWNKSLCKSGHNSNDDKGDLWWQKAMGRNKTESFQPNQKYFIIFINKCWIQCSLYFFLFRHNGWQCYSTKSCIFKPHKQNSNNWIGKKEEKNNEKYAADVFRSTMLCRSKGKTVLYINKLWHRIKNGYFICLFWRTRSLFVALFILFCIKRHSTKTYTQIIRCVFQVSKEKINFLSIFNFYRHWNGFFNQSRWLNVFFLNPSND